MSGSSCWTATRSTRCWRSRCEPDTPPPLVGGGGGRRPRLPHEPLPPTLVRFRPSPQGEREMTAAARTVTEDEADIRLDRWFRRHFPGLTQGAIQKLCRTGQVRVDGHRAEAATRLCRRPVGSRSAAARAPGAEARTHDRRAHRAGPAAPGDLSRRPRAGAEQAARHAGAGRPRHHPSPRRAARRAALRLAGSAAPGAPPGPRHVRRAAARPHAGHRGEARRCVPQPRRWRRPTGPSSRAGPCRSEGRIDLPLQRIGGARGERTEVAEPRRQGSGPRHHRLPHARSCRRRSWRGWSCSR